MKKILAILVVLIVVAIAVPKFIAPQVTQNLESTISRVNALPAYSVQLVEYHEGWFSSQGKILLKIDLAMVAPNDQMELTELPNEFELDFYAQHGPVMLGKLSGVGLANWRLTLIDEKLTADLILPEGEDLYQVTGRLGFFGATDIADKISAFTFSQQQDQVLEFKGYRGAGSFSAEDYEYEGQFNGMIANSPDGLFQVDKFTLEVAGDGNIFASMNNRLLDSEVEFELDGIIIDLTAKGKQLITLSKLDLSADTNIDKEKNHLSYVQLIKIKSVVVDGYKISDITFNSDVSNISVPFLKAYQQLAPNISATDPAADQQKVAEFLQTHLVQLLVEEPNLTISELSFNTPDGSLSANMSTTVTGVTTLPATLKDPGFWISHLTADALILADKGLMEIIASNHMKNQLRQNPQTAGLTEQEIEDIATQQTPMMLQMGQQQGLIVEENGKYKAKLTLENGELVLNEKPIPLPF